jgi:hypothetical protein
LVPSLWASKEKELAGRQASESPPQTSNLATTSNQCAAPNNTPKNPVQTRMSGTNPGQRYGQEAGHRMFLHRFRVVRPTRRPRTDALQGLMDFGRNVFRTAVGAGRKRFSTDEGLVIQ